LTATGLADRLGNLIRSLLNKIDQSQARPIFVLTRREGKGCVPVFVVNRGHVQRVFRLFQVLRQRLLNQIFWATSDQIEDSAPLWVQIDGRVEAALEAPLYMTGARGLLTDSTTRAFQVSQGRVKSHLRVFCFLRVALAVELVRR